MEGERGPSPLMLVRRTICSGMLPIGGPAIAR